MLVSRDLSTLRKQKQKQVPQLAYVAPATWQIQGAKDAVRADVACPGAKTHAKKLTQKTGKSPRKRKGD